MRRVIHFAQNDFKLAYREPMLRLMLCMPLLILVVVWFIVPLVIARFPVVAEYTHIILMWAALQTSVMFGFINGFLYLDEKEERVYQAIQVLPIAAGHMLLSRSLLGIGLSFIINLVLLLYGGLLPVPNIAALLLAFQYSLLGPLLSLLLLVFAQNKVEGMAQFKVYNLFCLLPVLVFFLPGWWMHILGAIPTYWSFRSIYLLPDEGWLISLLTGFAVYGIYLTGILYLLKKRPL